jgi:prepilin-type N-terminal cleavage/methylation domain-containing protein
MTKLSNSKAFTLVEMMVVVAVLGILISLTAFAMRGWQQSIEQRQVRSDLTMAATAMESTKNFGAGYPTALPSTFTSANGVSMQFVWGDSSQYCIQASSKKLTTIAYYVVSSQSKEPQIGSCPASPIPPAGPGVPPAPSPSVASMSSSSVRVTWAGVSGATSYSVKIGTANPPTAVSSCTVSGCTITGLSANTTYYVTVTASNASGGTTSAVVSAQTEIPDPSTASIAYVKSTYKNGLGTYRRYSITASGGTCAIGSTQWQINASGIGFNESWPWEVPNTKDVDIPENGQYSADDVTMWATPRCVSGSKTSYGNTATAVSGAGANSGGGAAF